MAAAMAQTIAVVDRSGKVVSTSKQLKNVFMEAKFAYQERKAEIVAERRAKAAARQEKALRRGVTELQIEDAPSEHSHTSRRRHSHHKHHDPERRPRPEDLRRHHSGSSLGSPRRRDHDFSPRSPASSHSRSPRHDLPTSHHSRSIPTSPASSHSRSPPHDSPTFHHPRSIPTSPASPQDPNRRHSVSLVRRRTDMDLAQLSPTQPRRSPVRSASTTAIDMDLAYGDYHPSSIAAEDEKELLTLVDRAKLLLDEANCAQHSVKAIIERLQNDPDAMAAVALTLAEISNIASKMAPGALTALKGSAPAVFALLASPQFLIAAGVGIGVTVVMFGGYKIIKKIKAKHAAHKEGSMDEMMAIDGDEVNRINAWRRGIVAPAGDGDSEINSIGTSVDGEFITPMAASMRGMETREDLSGSSEKERRKREKKEGKELKELKRKEKKKERRGKEEGSEVGSESSSRRSSSSAKLGPEDGKRALVKVKKPSPLRRLLA